MVNGLAALGALERVGKALRPYADRITKLRAELVIVGITVLCDLLWQWLRDKPA